MNAKSRAKKPITKLRKRTSDIDPPLITIGIYPGAGQLRAKKDHQKVKKPSRLFLGAYCQADDGRIPP
jgi:hypothetical protein